MNVLRFYVLITSCLLLVGFVFNMVTTTSKSRRKVIGGLIIAYILPAIYLAVYL